MKRKASTTPHPYMVPALERGIRILELLSRHPEGLLMTEMSSLSLPPASLYRMLTTLLELGYVIRDGADRYHTGRKLLTLGFRGADESVLLERSLGPMRELRNRTGESVMLGVLHGEEGVVIGSVISDQAVCVSIRIGHHYPLHTAAPAKAMLAFLPDREREALLRRIVYTKFTERTHPDAESLERELQEIRRSGIAYDRGEELRELRCAGAPIRSANGYPVAALWIGGPESRLDETTLRRYGTEVRKTAEEIQSYLVQ